uniref:Putative helicase n=2 Tax=viral metagenome TaxID=1070528 RepID=A0A6M3J6S2_9ZZZZ
MTSLLDPNTYLKGLKGAKSALSKIKEYTVATPEHKTGILNNIKSQVSDYVVEKAEKAKLPSTKPQFDFSRAKRKDQINSLKDTSFLYGQGNTPLEKTTFKDIKGSTDFKWKPPKELDLNKPDEKFLNMSPQEQKEYVKVYGERGMYKEQLDKIYSKDFDKRKREILKEARPVREGYTEPNDLVQAWDTVRQTTVSLIGSIGSNIEKKGQKYNKPMIERFGAKIADNAEKKILQNPEWNPPEDMGKWDDPTFYVRGVANAIPSIAGAIGVALATAPAGPIAQGVAMYSFTSSLEGGGAYRELIESGVPRDQAMKASDKIGMINGMLEQVPIFRLINKTPGGKQLTGKLVKDVAVSFIKQGFEEGFTESLQELVSNTVTKDYIANRGVWDNVLESGVFGFLSGGLMDSTTSFIQSPLVREAMKQLQADKSGHAQISMFGDEELTPNEKESKIEADKQLPNANRPDQISDVSRNEQNKPINAGEISTGPSEAGRNGGRSATSTGVGLQSDINTQAREIVKKPLSQITEEDKAILRRYEGAGGRETKGEQGRGLLDEYYTPTPIVKEMWGLAKQYGFQEGMDVIEPSVGTGRFIEEGPKANYTGIEIDETSSKIATILTKEKGAKIYNMGFENVFVDKNGKKKPLQPTADLIIGNPPYGAHRGYYKTLDEKGIGKYEEYFIKKGLDLLKDDGTLVMVVPSSFLKTKSSKAKQIIAEKGQLVDAIRLPEGTFGTTSIGTDIIVIKKGKGKVDDYLEDSFFTNNPDKIRGEVKTRKNRFGKDETYVAKKEAKKWDVTEKIAEAKKEGKALILDSDDVKKTLPGYDPNNPSLVHAESSKIIKEAFDTALADPYFETVTFLGGGTGSGKSEVLIKGIKNTPKKIIYDGTMAGMDGVMIRQKKAKKAGKEMDFRVVIAKIEEAWKWNLARERSVEKNIFADKHFGFRKTLYEVARDNPDFNINVFENNEDIEKGGREIIFDNHQEMVDFLEKKVYTKNEVEQLIKNHEVRAKNRQQGVGARSSRTGREGRNEQREANKRPSNIEGTAKEGGISKDQPRVDIVEARESSGQYYKSATPYTQEELDVWNAKNPDGSIDKDKVKNPDILNVYKGKLYDDFDYLSGNIYEKLDQLKKEGLDKAKMEEQERKLKEVLPKTKTIKELDINPIGEFAQDFQIKDETLRGMFKEYLSDLPNEAFKPSSRYEVLGYLNDDAVRTYGDKKLAFVIKQRRKATAEKFFKKFLESIDPEVQADIEDKMNRRINSYVRPDYTKVPLTVDGLDTSFGGRGLLMPDYKLDSIGFLTNKGLGINANGVGLGKTMMAIISTVQDIQKGWYKKPLYIVPRQVYDKWIEEIKLLFPKQRVVGLGNLGTKYNINSAEDLRGKIKDGDITVVTHEALMKLGFKDETVSKLSSDIKNAYNEDSVKKQTERAKELEKAKGEELVGKARASADIKIEDLGFDNIVVDEAHNFKNIFSRAKSKEGSSFRGRWGGLQGPSSARGVKLWFLSQYIQSLNGGRGVKMLTATPFSNNPLEYYNMLSLLAMDEMREMGIDNINTFMDTFVKSKHTFIVKPGGKFEMGEVIEDWQNAELLKDFIGRYIDFKDGENYGVNRPDKHVRDHRLSPTAQQLNLIDEAQELLDAKFKDKGGTLVYIDEAKKITLSPSLSRYYKGPEMSAKEFVETSPKLMAMMSMIKANKKQSGQLIYYPLAVDTMPKIKEYLVTQLKYKADEVGIVSGSTTDAQREKTKDGFNNGTIKVVIGSDAVKEGIDLQRQATDLFITSYPWRPTDITQVEGRIHRQGNKFANVRVHFLSVQDTIDPFLFQKMETKARRLSNASALDQVMDVSDIDWEEAKADLIRDPSARLSVQKAQKKQSVDMELSAVTAEKAMAEDLITKENNLLDDIRRYKDMLGDYPKGHNMHDYYKKQHKKAESKLNAFLKRDIDKDELVAKVEDLKVQEEEKKKQIEQIDKEFAEKEKALPPYRQIEPEPNDFKKFQDEMESDNKSLLYEKGAKPIVQDRNIMEIENADLTDEQLEEKLSVAEEGKEDVEMINIIKEDIIRRKNQDEITDPLYEFNSDIGIEDEDIARGTVIEAIDDIGGIENVERGVVNIDDLVPTESVNMDSVRGRNVLEAVRSGERTPIIIDNYMQVMDGHHRIKAYQELGIKQIPAIAPIGTINVEDKPIYGKQYRLTGKDSIAEGKTWAEAEVDIEDYSDIRTKIKNNDMDYQEAVDTLDVLKNMKSPKEIINEVEAYKNEKELIMIEDNKSVQEEFKKDIEAIEKAQKGEGALTDDEVTQEIALILKKNRFAFTKKGFTLENWIDKYMATKDWPSFVDHFLNIHKEGLEKGLKWPNRPEVQSFLNKLESGIMDDVEMENVIDKLPYYLKQPINAKKQRTQERVTKIYPSVSEIETTTTREAKEDIRKREEARQPIELEDKYEVNEIGVVLNPDIAEVYKGKDLKWKIEFAKTKDGKYAFATDFSSETGNYEGASSAVSKNDEYGDFNKGLKEQKERIKQRLERGIKQNLGPQGYKAQAQAYKEGLEYIKSGKKTSLKLIEQTKKEDEEFKKYYDSLIDVQRLRMKSVEVKTEEAPKEVATVEAVPQVDREFYRNKLNNVLITKDNGLDQIVPEEDIKPVEPTDEPPAEPPTQKPKPKKEKPKPQKVDLGKLDRFRVLVQDRMLPMERLQQKVGVNEEEDVYMSEELYSGRVTEAIETFQREKEDVIREQINELTKGENQDQLKGLVQDYLHLKHAPERNKQHYDGASGIKTSEAIERLKLIELHPKYKDIQKAGNLIQELASSLPQFLLQNELITDDTFEILNKTYKNYVPLNRIMDDETDFVNTLGIGQGFDIRGNEVKRAVGSHRKIDDIFANVVSNWERAIMRAEKNKVGQSVYKFAKQYPELGVFEIMPAIPKHLMDKDGGDYWVREAPKSPNVLSVKIEGKSKYIKINDPNLAQALKNLNMDNSNLMIKLLAPFTRYISMINTSLNPEFLVSNFLRDIQQSTLNNVNDMGFSKSIKTSARVFEAQKGVLDYYRGKDTEMASLYKELKAEGGTTGFFNIRNKDDITNLLKEAEKEWSNGAIGMPMKAGKKVVDAISVLNDIIENGTRLATYKTALEMGKSKKRAAQMAKNITVNFNKKGQLGPTINALYAFSNASIQGSFRTFKALKNPKTAIPIISTITMLTLALNAWNDWYDEEDYARIPEYEKEGNWIFMYGDGDYIKIPLPWGFNVFKVATDYGYQLSKGETSTKYGIGRTAIALLNAYNPIGGSSIMQAITPTMARPFFDINANTAWHGGNVRPTNFTNIKESLNYFQSTNDLFKDLASWISNITGGEGAKPGLLEMSPEDLEYLWAQYTGGVGTFLSRSYNALGNMITGKETPINEVPFQRRVMGSVNLEKFNMGQIYDILDSSKQQVLEKKDRDQLLNILKDEVKAGRYEKDEAISKMKEFDRWQEDLELVDKQAQYIKEKGLEGEKLARFYEALQDKDFMKKRGLDKFNKTQIKILKSYTGNVSIKEDEAKNEATSAKTEDDLIDVVVRYANAFKVDPSSAFVTLFTGEKLKDVRGDSVIMERMGFEKSTKIKEGLANGMVLEEIKLDHTIPLELGGSNSKRNLKIVSNDEWASYTPVENYLGKKLNKGEIKEKEAQALITQFKNGEITADYIYNY